MKILAINGSPKGKNGNTDILLREFIMAAEEANADCEIIYLKDKNIKSCTGCFSCVHTSKKQCILKDDMEEILDKVNAADALIFATPLYFFNVTGIMKIFIDRLFPLQSLSDFIDNDSESISKKTPSILISTCGFSGSNYFNGLLETFKLMKFYPLEAYILCSQGELLHQPQLKPITDVYLENVHQAGLEFAKTGHISKSLETKLHEKLLDESIFNKIIKSHFL